MTEAAPAPSLVFPIAPPAVGTMTVGMELARRFDDRDDGLLIDNTNLSPGGVAERIIARLGLPVSTGDAAPEG